MKTITALTTAVMILMGVAVVTGASMAMSPRPHTADTPARPAADRHACFDPTFTEGFQSIGDNRLIITAPHRQVYELTLGGVCIGLDTSFAVGIRSRMGTSQVCGPFDADIVFRDMGGGQRLQSCPITDVRRLSDAEAAAYLSPPRKAKK